jgi:HlyD family secretion protein
MDPIDRESRDRGSGPRSRLGSRLIVVVVLVGIGGVLAWSALPVIRPARAVGVVQAVFVRSDAATPLAEEQGIGRDIPTVQAPGWLEAEPFYVACTALADGIVESIDVLEGDFVERGDVVARLVTEDSEIRLRLAEAELADARAALRIAEAEREAADEVWREPVELQRAVASRAAAVAENEAELAQLPSLIEAAVATLRQREEELTRVGRSQRSGAANELELIVAEQRELFQRAEVEALRARGPVLEARARRLRAELHAAERDLELRTEDRRRLRAAGAAVDLALAVVARAEASVADAVLELSRMTIEAPISGFVMRRLKVPGDKVIRAMDSPFSAHLVHLYDPDQIRVRVDVPLADASHVFVGQACEVVVEVLPDRVFRAEVLRVTHEADLQKNTLEVQVKVHDPDPLLRPEMLTRVKFVSPSDGRSAGSRGESDAGSEVLLPENAIHREGGRSLAWVVRQRRNNRGLLEPASVDVLSHDEGWVRIRGEVRPGDLVAVGIRNPRAGELVTVSGLADADRGGAM